MPRELRPRLHLPLARILARIGAKNASSRAETITLFRVFDPEATYLLTYPQFMAGLAVLGISIDTVTDELERDGVAKFVQSWHELLDTVQSAMDQAE